MTSSKVLLDGFERIRELVEQVADGLDAPALEHRIDPAANSIGWLLWHLTRVQDDHVSAAAGVEQAWTAQGWATRFDLPFDVDSIGYGHSSAEVAQVRASAELLAGYHRAVHEQTVRFVASLADADLDRVVDTSWNPPVTLGVRLVSVLSDDLQHVGQAAFIRGVVQRAASGGVVQRAASGGVVERAASGGV